MQSHVDRTDEQRPVLPNDNRDRVSDTYVLRKTVDADNAENVVTSATRIGRARTAWFD